MAKIGFASIEKLRKQSAMKSAAKATSKPATKPAVPKSPMKSAAKSETYSTVWQDRSNRAVKKQVTWKEEPMQMTSQAKKVVAARAAGCSKELLKEAAKPKTIVLKDLPDEPSTSEDEHFKTSTPLPDDIQARVLKKIDALKKENELASGVATASSTASASYKGPEASSAASLKRSSEAVTTEGQLDDKSNKNKTKKYI